ncbi:RING finger protein 17 isoform X1 [Poecilia latipinna]|uniref:Ring finger protein 17 n=1 Tax=Poecilia latipinna TaxID=48699 RepID=A0A3B3VAV5_9TELE|nr:PREDICTED: RING finger protein 17 isoform X1 [Poecilia latipinna]XP_014900532.1 PREDICTED: RING finger protein 17 isoform X1 [Poecilia latipinna]
MMDKGDSPSAAICKLCGNAFKLPEDKTDGNLPRILACGHIFCTNCLASIECEGAIRCPDCEFWATLPEGGVNGLQEESRIIGLIYTAEMNQIKSLRCNGPKVCQKNRTSPRASTISNSDFVKQPADIEKIEKTVDESLVQAAENLAQLENIYEALTADLAEQVKRERTRLEMELTQASNKAVHMIQKWKDTQLNQLKKMETHFPSGRAVVSHVQERIKALEIAMQMAREIRRVPFLEQYCILDKVLETLQTPVDHKAIDLKCIAEGTGMSCVFQSDNVSQCLTLSLKMEACGSNAVIKQPAGNHQSDDSIKSSSRKHVKYRNGFSNLPSSKPDKWEPESPGASRSSPQGTHLAPKPAPRISSFSDLGSPDVIIEEFFDDNPEPVTPTGPEMANIEWRTQRRRKCHLRDKKCKEVTHWVVVTHVVNPSHFYVRYVAEKKESEVLSRKINELCVGEGCQFTLGDTMERGSMIFVKWKDVVWCRATVVEVFQKSCVKAVKACPVTQLASLRVFFPDYGFTKSITIQSEKEAAESLLKAVNNHLRKVAESVSVELNNFAPQAVRCSLKDLVPYNLTEGWSEEAKAEFCCVVGSAAVEMRPLGQDKDSLLVDLRKAPMEQSTDVPISVREYLVFIEVARFYSPVTLGRKPLMYYPPVYPEASAELDAVVSHINSLSDFYIQLVDNMESLLLSAKLQDYYSALKDDEFRVYCPVIGQACVARFEDKLWYRAQVISHPGGRKVEVRYVDFGNKQVLSVSDLRKIKDEFFALPAMAVHCCLADVTPLDGESWSEACTKRFISLAHQQLVTVKAKGKVPKTEPLPLGVFVGGVNEPKTSIAELLANENLVCFKESKQRTKNKKPSRPDSTVWDPPLEPGAAAAKAEASGHVTVEEQNNDPVELQPQLKLPDQRKDLKVMVTHVNSPSSFYVRLTNSDRQLKRICELVKQECALMEPQEVVWKADMYCAANINGVWERGRICSDVTSSNTAEVRRCDHGNKVKIHVSNLYPLPSSLIGSLAMECTLNDIRPTGGRSTWTDTACDLISYYLTGASALMTIKEEADEHPLPVTLSCSNRMGEYISIADFLVDEGLAFRERKPKVQKPKETDTQTPATDPESCEKERSNSPPPVSPFPPTQAASTPPKPFPRSIVTAEKVKTSMYNPPELPCPGHILINVSAIGDDGVIYARTQSAEYQLEQLKEGIQKSIKTLPRQKPYTWKSVQGCAVIGPDMLWYRGQLLELLGGHVKVQYVDYGLVENIPVVHVYPMLLCVEVPQLCIPCQLFGINPVGGKWQRDGVALMREVLLNRSVDMQVVALPAEPRGAVTVEIFLDGMSLSRILCHNEHASMDGALSKKSLVVTPPASLLDVWDISTESLMGPEEPVLGSFVSPNLPLEGEHFEVRVTHLWTPNEMFLWPLKDTADSEMMDDSLDEALTRINADITSLPRLTSFPYGGPCLAEYSDGKYYRARLMKFTSIEPLMILVQHVDFGSDDSLPTSKLRQMPPELLLFPTRAIKVKVAGFKAPSVEWHGDVLPYCPVWSVKAVMEMTDLLHNNITATVISREPELKVQLFNEDRELVHLPLVNSGLAELD